MELQIFISSKLNFPIPMSKNQAQKVNAISKIYEFFINRNRSDKIPIRKLAFPENEDIKALWDPRNGLDLVHALIEEFNKLDLSGNGSLSHAEFSTGNEGSYTKPFIDCLFQRFPRMVSKL
jgi:hypothetical protein